jgi:hypothetical protein
LPDPASEFDHRIGVSTLDLGVSEMAMARISIRTSYVYRLARQVARECFSFSREQIIPLLIALIGAWATLHYGLVPIPQTRAAYEAYLLPFVPAFLIYLVYQIARAPYVLDREQRALIKELEPLRDRKWRPLNDQEKTGLAKRLATLGVHRIGIGYRDSTDCSDLADDLTEVVQRAGWTQPVAPGVTYDSIGAKGVAVHGKVDDQLASLVRLAIAETTYVKTTVGKALPSNARVSQLVDDKPVDYEIDLMIVVGAVSRA